MTTIAAAFALRRSHLAELANVGKRSLASLGFFDTKARALLAGLGEKRSLARLDATAVDAYISTRRVTVCENTIQKELAVLRGVLTLAVRRGLWAGDGRRVLPDGFATEYKPKTRWLPESELESLLEHLRTPDARARVAFMVATSAEQGATDRALRQDVVGDLVHVRGTKRARRDRVVPIVTPWQKRLMARVQCEAGGTAPALFAPWTNIRRDLRLACGAAGILPCSPNDLRRTCATRLWADGMQLETIAPVMGHADTRMLFRVYAHRTPEQLAERMRAESQP